jgi:signal transduction histidine kinase
LAEAQRSAQRYRDLVASHEQVSQEIQARKALEARLHEARRMESIGKLTGRFAHEFNNLLTVVLGNLEIVLEATETTEVQRSLADARRAAERSAFLVRDMLSFAQRTRLSPVETDLNAIVRVFAQALSPFNGMVIDLVLEEALWTILIDTKALEQILCNLIDNAVTAVSAGGSITIRTENMQKEVSEDSSGEIPGDMELPPGRYVRVSVEDTGTGIPEERLSQIFDPFFTTKPVGNGTGLGLSIVRGLIQQSGGAISVVSKLDKGSTFHLLFPALG